MLTSSIVAFSIAGILLAVFATLFAFKGFRKMEDASLVFETTTGELRELLGEARHISADLIALKDATLAMYFRIQREYANPCPGWTSFDSSDLGKGMNDVFQSTLKKLALWMTDMDHIVDSLVDGTEDIDIGLDTSDEVIAKVQDYELVGKA